VLPLARNLNVLTVRLTSSLSCALHPDLLMTFFNNLLIHTVRIQPDS